MPASATGLSKRRTPDRAPSNKGAGRVLPTLPSQASAQARAVRPGSPPGPGGPPLQPISMSHGGAVNQHKMMAMGVKAGGSVKKGRKAC